MGLLIGPPQISKKRVEYLKVLNSRVPKGPMVEYLKVMAALTVEPAYASLSVEPPVGSLH